ALNIALSLPGGATGIAPISALGHNFVISGAFDLSLNTTGIQRTDPNTGQGIAPGYNVFVNNLGIYVYGFNATGQISIGISTSGFIFTTNVSLDFFGLGSLNIFGFYFSPTNFSFTGSGGFQLGDHTFGLGGTASMTVSSNGFAGSISGWAAA